MTNPNKTRRDSTLARIRALMAKTIDNGCTEAEAREAARKVDELMALYEIDLDEVSMRQSEIISVKVPFGQHTIRHALWAIGNFTDCRCWLQDDNVVFLGFQVDTEIAEYLTFMFKRAIDREAATFVLFNPAWDHAGKHGQPELLRSFGIGMATRLGERLSELKSKRDFTQRTSGGRDLVVMKKPLVDAAMQTLGIILGGARTERPAAHRAAFAAGQSAAANVAINQGVAERAARQAGRLV